MSFVEMMDGAIALSLRERISAAFLHLLPSIPGCKAVARNSSCGVLQNISSSIVSSGSHRIVQCCLRTFAKMFETPRAGCYNGAGRFSHPGAAPISGRMPGCNNPPAPRVYRAEGSAKREAKEYYGYG